MFGHCGVPGANAAKVSNPNSNIVCVNSVNARLATLEVTSSECGPATWRATKFRWMS